MRKYEYRVILAHQGDLGIDPLLKNKVGDLAEFGEYGWLLCAVAPIRGPYHAFFYARERPQEDPPKLVLAARHMISVLFQEHDDWTSEISLLRDGLDEMGYAHE